MKIHFKNSGSDATVDEDEKPAQNRKYDSQFLLLKGGKKGQNILSNGQNIPVGFPRQIGATNTGNWWDKGKGW